VANKQKSDTLLHPRIPHQLLMSTLCPAIASGDRAENVARLAARYGITDRHGGLDPAAKLALLEANDPEHTLMIGDGIRIKDVSVKNLGIIPDTFRRLGVEIEEKGDDLFIPRQEHYDIESFIDGTIMTIADAPWPGLTPDLLSVLIVVATQARGSVLFHQKMFESRLFFVDKIIDMGAQIILCDPHRAVVIGHDHKLQLRAGRMTSPDIRAGIALLIAALSANGTSQIDNIAQIDRGYEDIEARLNALGANIKRV